MNVVILPDPDEIRAAVGDAIGAVLGSIHGLPHGMNVHDATEVAVARIMGTGFYIAG